MSQSDGVLKGICHFFSETGSEGGVWAFQDVRYIKKNVGKGFCKKCGKWLRDQSGAIQVKRVYKIDEELLRILGTETLPERADCPNGAHEEEISDEYEWEGFHVLKNGDRLTIYAKDNPSEIVWSGTIRLRQYPRFTKHASGMWIHADQKGVDRETWARWFLEEYPAALVVA